MKITIKNLQRQTFTVNFEPEKSVLELKERIFKERGPEYIVEKQKLIYAGVILDNERSVASYNVDEKKFVVVMLQRDLNSATKKSSQVGDADSNASETIASKNESKVLSSENCDKNLTIRLDSGAEEHENSKGTSGLDENSEGASVVPMETNNPSSENTVGLQNSESRAESHLLMGEEYIRSVESMIEMGYSRELVERAMAASFNNPERAVEYLISGIPDSGIGFNTSTVSTSRSDSVGIDNSTNVEVASERERQQSDGAAVSESSTSDDPFEFLRNQPQFLQMRSLVYQNPDLLHAVLQQIGQTNPALLQLISENQEAFLSMLNQPMESSVHLGGQRRENQGNSSLGESVPAPNERERDRTGIHERGTNAAAIAALTAAASAASAASGQEITARGERRELEAPQEHIPVSSNSVGGSAEGVTTIRLTRQDQDAIERLKALGFPEALVLQAYFACEKNEQLAANFLISSAFDD